MALTRTRPQAGTRSELIAAALRFARRVHLGQHRRQTYDQYVEHPIAVARLLSEAGFDGTVLVAAYLHDVVEKTPVEIDEVRERFGIEVAEIVDALSEDPGIPDYAGRKRALRARAIGAGLSAAGIFAADRLANMRDWRSLEPAERERCALRLGTRLDERLRLWAEDREALPARDPRLPFLPEIEAELAALRAEAGAVARIRV